MVHLASLNDEQAQSVQQLDASYVAGLFDGYAARFEQELIQDLNYQGHLLVTNALKAQLDLNKAPCQQSVTTIVDLGCGTGLLGELLRKLFHGIGSWCTLPDRSCSPANVRILGVDLSQRMVDISRGRMATIDDDSVIVYDQVELSDGVAYLQTLASHSVAAVTASDVFIYIGSLEDTFRECARVLLEGGLLVFTVELPDPESESDVKLLKSGRFGHSKAHVEKVAKSFGFRVDFWENAVLRTQGGNPVAGAVVVLRNGAG